MSERTGDGRTGDGRPTADQMLARVGAAERDPERADGRGRLRVYVGMAPGVGKTFSMLQEGHRRTERGTDLVVGFVETHGRRRTAELTEGLEIVPRRRIEYRGVVVEEMDTEAVIARHPQVVLVDELAHTNAPGSPRAKRWEDVEALLDAGIDVISTCNVQHLESHADAVATITGAPVNERLPDAVLAEADEVDLVDMSPGALRQRIRHGNVYPPDRARVALDRFFTEANLTALREFSLRFVAERVDEQLEGIAGAQGREIVTTHDRVLVLLDGRASTGRAVRRAAAIAAALRAPLLGVIVETPAAARRTFDQARDLQERVDDAVDLGLEVITVSAPDMVSGLLDVAVRRGSTHIVLVQDDRGAMGRLRHASTAEELLARLPNLEVHLVAAASPETRPARG